MNSFFINGNSRYILYSIAALVLGFCPYLLIRGIHINKIHIKPLLDIIAIPYFIKYSVSDGLWTMSLSYTLIYIWMKNKVLVLIFSTLIAPLLGITLEILQSKNLIFGTFDYIDIISIIVFYLLTITHYFYAQEKFI